MDKKNRGLFFSSLAIVLISFSMRAPMGTVGPLIEEVQNTLSLTSWQAGMITSLPLILFSICSPLALFLIKKFSIRNLILCYLSVLLVGIILRSNIGVWGMFMGTCLIGATTGLLNVTMPSLIRGGFPEKTGPLMGLYTSSMTLSSALIATLSQVLAIAFGSWRLSMLSVAIVVALAIPAVFSFIPKEVSSKGEEKTKVKILSLSNISIALYMGFQSLVFYSVLSWLPKIVSSSYTLPFRSGLVITIIQTISLLPAFLVPILSQKVNVRGLSVGLSLLFIPGILVIGFGSSLPLLFLGAIFCGVSLGGTFSMALSFCTLKGKTATKTAALTSFGQFVGYILASIGPVFIGKLYDSLHSWTPAIVMMAVFSSLMALFGFIAGEKE